MEFKLKVDREKYTVDIDDSQNMSDLFTVNSSGKPHDMKICRVDKNKDISAVMIDNKMYDVEIVRNKTGIPKEVIIEGQRFPIDFEKINRQRFFIEKPRKLKDGTMRAAIPGQIVGLFVTAGDTVNEGDTLFILEAMKMENEIKSPRSGTVAKVNIKVGDTVSSNDILMIIE